MRAKGTLLAVTLAALAWGGCGGASYEGGVYREGSLRFRTGPAPSAWRRIEATGARLAFRDDAAGATVLVNARCGADADDTPLAALTAHLFLMFTERRVDEQTVVPMDGREAMRTRMTAKLDGVPKVFEAYVLKKDGCVYDLVSVAAPESGSRTAQAFEGFVAGFRALSGGP